MEKRTKTHGSIAKFGGDVSLVDRNTGEIFNAKVVHYDGADKNFTKLWLAYLIDALNVMGNKKIQLLAWLIDNRNSQNQIIKTVKEIAIKSKISETTVKETLGLLVKMDIITRRNGLIIFNADVIFKGSHENRMSVLINYRELIGNKE